MNSEDRRSLIEKAVEDFGAVVHEFRIKNHLTLLDFAEITGFSSSFICRIEQKKRKADLDTRVQIMALGMAWTTEDVYLYLDKYIAKTKLNTTSN